MGHYLVKFRSGASEYWGLKEKEYFLPLKEQPQDLRSLILAKEDFLAAGNILEDQIPAEGTELLAPVSRPLRIICQGVNYASHREESALDRNSRGNVMFAKDESAITGPSSPVMRPKDCHCLDYEVELGLIIGADIQRPVEITPENLDKYIAGFLIANDFSPRDLQYKEDYAQWYKAKSCRTMLPLGPVLYLPDKEDFAELFHLRLQLWVNDTLRQDAHTGQLIFKPAETLTEISTFMDINAGDLLLTGTPGGVVVKAPGKLLQGIATWLLSNEKKVEILRRKKALYLQDGDIVTARIYSPNGRIDLGIQQNTIVPFELKQD